MQEKDIARQLLDLRFRASRPMVKNTDQVSTRWTHPLADSEIKNTTDEGLTHSTHPSSRLLAEGEMIMFEIEQENVELGENKDKKCIIVSKEPTFKKVQYLPEITINAYMVDDHSVKGFNEDNFGELTTQHNYVKVLGVGSGLCDPETPTTPNSFSRTKEALAEQLNNMLPNGSIIVTDGDDYKTDSFMSVIHELMRINEKVGWIHIRIEDYPDAWENAKNKNSFESAAAYNLRYYEMGSKFSKMDKSILDRIDFYIMPRNTELDKKDPNLQGIQTLHLCRRFVIIGSQPGAINTTSKEVKYLETLQINGEIFQLNTSIQPEFFTRDLDYLKRQEIIKESENLSEREYNTTLRGNFYVSGGIEIIEPIADLIKASHTVFLSIDAHPVGHVSFHTTQGSPYGFPPHCVNNQVGQCVVRQIYDEAKNKTNPEAKFFFKACEEGVDSFGAVKYADCHGNELNGPFCDKTNYPNAKGNTVCNARNIVIDCKDGSQDMSVTGSFMATDTSFNGLYKENIAGRIPRDAEARERQRFLTHLSQNPQITDVYVCGLAGDWCTLDTCVNLARARPGIQVYYLVDFTKFSCLPDFVINDEKLIDPGLRARYMQFLKTIELPGGPLNLYYLNHPLLTFGLLRQSNVNIVVGGSEKTRDKEYLKAGNMATLSTPNINMDLSQLEAALSKDSAALFVIDMQNDFSLPSADHNIHGGPRDIVYENQKLVSGLVQDFNAMSQQSGSGFGVVLPENQ